MWTLADLGNSLRGGLHPTTLQRQPWGRGKVSHPSATFLLEPRCCQAATTQRNSSSFSATFLTILSVSLARGAAAVFYPVGPEQRFPAAQKVWARRRERTSNRAESQSEQHTPGTAAQAGGAYSSLAETNGAGRWVYRHYRTD